jgi:MFS family permease
MSAAVADIVPPENRAGAFGILFASVSVGYCISAFIAPFFSRVRAHPTAKGCQDALL